MLKLLKLVGKQLVLHCQIGMIEAGFERLRNISPIKKLLNIKLRGSAMTFMRPLNTHDGLLERPTCLLMFNVLDALCIGKHL